MLRMNSWPGLGAMWSIICLVGLASVELAAAEPPVLLLWPDGAPGAVGDEAKDKPTLAVYLPAPEKNSRTGVVVCPGGSYGGLALDHEGKQVADWLNSHGVAAFVLSYRLGPRYRHPAPLQDAQRAIRTVRARSDEWKVDPGRIGILGFSAGGHLASTAGTHFDSGKADATDAIERASCRPDFLILGYPVITFSAPFVHKGSLRNLLSDKPDEGLVDYLSNEKQVTAQTPPTFMAHTDADTVVPPENSVLFYLALRKAGVPAELHIYEKGGHGLGLGGGDAAFATWPEHCITWLKVRGILDR